MAVWGHGDLAVQAVRDYNPPRYPHNRSLLSRPSQNMNDVSPRDLCIAYALLPFLTPVRIRLLLEHFSPLQEVRRAPARLLQGLLSLDREQAEVVMNPLRNRDLSAQIESVRSSAVAIVDAEYPPLLKEIIDPPLALFYRGDLSLLQKPLVAVVGSRRASPYGMNAAEHLSQQLVSAGVAVVSGLARGICAAAQPAPLRPPGTTIPLLGTGLDTVYPPSHRP